LGLGLVLWSGNAWAESANCSVFEIRASNNGEGIDKELKPLEKKLKKPPFSAWKTFKVVKKHSTTIEQMKPSTIKLSDGGKLGLLYKDRADAKGRKPRLRVGMTLDNAQGKRKLELILKVDSGDFSLVGRDAGQDGSSSVLAIRCLVK
jgi:hypothetical protein